MKLEINATCNDPGVEELKGTGIIITPPIGEDYWLFRVAVSKKQALVGFPKFFTIGIGFQKEEDWNTNLPYTQPAESIFLHIAHNKKDNSISGQVCIDAIQLIKEAAVKYMKANKHTK